MVYIKGTGALTVNSILILWGGIHVLGTLLESFIFRKDDTHPTETTKLLNSGYKMDTANLTNDEQLSSSLEDKAEKKEPVSTTGLELLKSLDFCMVASSIIISVSVDKTIFYNIGTYLRSFKLEYNGQSIFLAGAILIIISKIVVGFLMHALQDKTQRITFQCVALLVKSVTLGLFTFYGDCFAILFLTAISVYVATPVEMMVTPIIMLEYYGAKYHARNLGSVLFVSTLFTLLLQFLVGSIYGMYVEEDSNTCYGLKCFLLSNILLLTLTLVALCFSIIVWYKRRNK